MNEQIRAEFAEWAAAEFDLTRSRQLRVGRYQCPQTRAALSAWMAAHAKYAGSESEAGLLEYILQDEIQNRLTPRIIDIAYTAFMLGKQPNSEDGGASDWFNDTRPAVMKAINTLRSELLPAQESASPSLAVPNAVILRDHASDWDYGYTSGWNSCREAMLSAQENTSPAPAVPDGWKIEIDSSNFARIVDIKNDRAAAFYCAGNDACAEKIAADFVKAMLTQATKESDK